MKKILSFEKDGEFYYNLAITHWEKGEYCAALEYLRRAVKRDPFCLDYLLAIAETYYDMGLFEYSTNEYFKILSLDDGVPECYFGLAQNYLCMDDFDAALYYFNMSLDLDLPDEEAEIAREVLSEIKDSSEPETASRDFSQMLSLAKNLMRQGEFGHAAHILGFIPETSGHFISAKSNLSLCKYLSGDPEGALSVTKSILERDPDNVFALCVNASVYGSAESADKEKLTAALNAVYSVKTEDVNSLYKIATTLCELKEHEKAVYYFEETLSFKPYDINSLLLLSIAFYNTDNIKSARDCVQKILKIDPASPAALYYAGLYAKTKNPNAPELDYVLQVPYDEAMQRCAKLNDILAMPAAVFESEYKRSGEFLELFKWSLSLNDLTLQSALIYKFCRVKEVRVYLETLLSDVFVSNFVKKEALSVLMLYGVKGSKLLVIGQTIKRVSFSRPKLLLNLPVCFSDAYARVFSTLAFMDEGFERKLVREMNVFLEECLPHTARFKTVDALAAVMANRLKGYEMFNKPQDVCQIFNAALSVFKQYIKLLGKGGAVLNEMSERNAAKPPKAVRAKTAAAKG